MKTAILKIPVRNVDNFGDPINTLIAFFNQVKNVQIIEFDFSECKFISPFLLGGLVSIAKRHVENGGEITVNEQYNNLYLKGYLDTIGFPNGKVFNANNSAESIKSLVYYHSKTYIPIVCFPTGKTVQENSIRESTLTAVNSIFKNQLGLSGQLLQAIFYMVDELTNNVSDHSKSGEGIIFAQFYPTKNYMDICIADYGRGLYQSYLDTEKHNPKNTEEAMNFAVYGKSTKDNSVSRGFGISTTREMLTKGLNGKFFLMSDNTFYIQSISKQEVVKVPDSSSYQGCFVALRIPILRSSNFTIYDYIEG